MREIKFRAFDKQSKKMDYNPYGDEYTGEGTPVNALLNSEYFFSDKPESYYSPLMQFTGLKDKNGVEIYEGDIVEVQNENEDVHMTRQVEWLEDGATFWLTKGDGKWTEDWEYNPFTLGGEDFEIVGNIYENPELLPKEEDPNKSQDTEGGEK